ncbi:MAG: hypothetical protein LBN20_06400 [Endomicrobium sp.]|jgi:hypothetical protein|nr:hypothetical protein [Endomicrobium sp.]
MKDIEKTPKNKIKRKYRRTKPRKKLLDITEDIYKKMAVMAGIKKAVKEGAYLTIDYPAKNEAINGAYHYAVRIGASNDGSVEISFDKNEWNPCRFSGGFWWFDIMSFKKGSCNIYARMLDAQGNIMVKTAARKCKIC